MTKEKHAPLVLVADDEVHTTMMLERIFEREGYRVTCAHDGLAALDAAQRLLPDLILLDIQMPGMNGFDVLRSLREKTITATIPTILITAKAREPADVAHGLNLGADDYLYKPFDPRELLARAESKMKARQLEEKLQRRTQELQALLRVGEELNQSLEINELLELVLFLSLDLLPGDVAAIYQFDDKGGIIAQRIQPPGAESLIYPAVMGQLFTHSADSIVWPPAPSPVDHYPNGMALALRYGESLLGALVIASQQATYDENHGRLFKGIVRQATLALRNANYASHLEDMVAARTEELRSAQQMLVRSEKLASIGHLAASIAHEINNPLQPIRIHLEHLLEDAHLGDPLDVMAIESIQQSIERITRIVSQLLEFAGKRSMVSDVHFFDIKRTLEGVISLNKKLFEQQNIHIVADIQSLPPIYGSKDQMEQVFMNLALNAHAAMDAGGELRISAWAADNNVIIEFADTGSGIDADQINRIFDPFFSTKPTGTGLGLFVSYGIIENHHGSISVQSELGAGTVFTIYLPIDPQNTA